MAGDTRLIHRTLQTVAEWHPSRIAVIQGRREYSYGDIHERASQLAAFFIEHDVKPGDRVCLVLDNSPEYLLAYFATLMAGGIVVPISDQSTHRGLRHVLLDCSPKVVIIRKKLIEVMREALGDCSYVGIVLITEKGEIWDSPPFQEVHFDTEGFKVYDLAQVVNGGSRRNDHAFPVLGEDLTAMIIYTSGTTGAPKGVMLSHRNLYVNAESIVRYLNLTCEDSVMVVLPFYYSYGNSLLTTHVLAGGRLVLENSFLYPNNILDRMIEEEVTGFAGVPSTFAILLNRSNLRTHRFSRLRYVTQAGGAMSPKHASELVEALPGTRVWVMYGQTEAAPRLTCLDPSDLHRKAGSIGKAIPSVRISLKKEDGRSASRGEIGEIVAEGENIMQGYWNSPDETAKVLKVDGLHTGDLARVDEDGYLFIVGRKSDMIKCGAHRISAKEIEETLLEIPQVHEAAVVGVLDDILGEAISAHIVLKPGMKINRNDVLSYCSKVLPPYKLPKRIQFVESLPKSESGKIQKQRIRGVEEG